MNFPAVLLLLWLGFAAAGAEPPAAASEPAPPRIRALAFLDDAIHSLRGSPRISDDFRALVLGDVAAWQVRAGDLPAAERTAARLDDPALAASAQAKIAVAQAQVGDLPAALRRVESFKDRVRIREALGGISAVQAAKGDPDGALRAVLRVEDPAGRDTALRDLTGWEIDAGNPSAARRAAAVIVGAEAKNATLEMLARAAAGQGDFATAYRTAERLPPDPFARLMLVLPYTQAQAGDLDGALRAIDERRALLDLEQTLFQFAGDRAEAGDLDGARRVAGRLADADRRATILGMVGIKQAEAGDLPAARRTAAALPDGRDRAGIVCALAAAQARAGALDGALLTVESLDKTGEWRPRAREAVVLARAEAGDVAGVRRAAAVPDGEPPDPWLESAVLIAQAQAGQLDDALHTLETLANLTVRTEALQTIAILRWQAGDLAGARRASDLLPDDGWRRSFRGRVVEAQIAARDVPGAVRTALLIEDWHEFEPAIRALADADPAAAEAAVRALPDGPERSRGFMALAAALLDPSAAPTAPKAEQGLK